MVILNAAPIHSREVEEAAAPIANFLTTRSIASGSMRPAASSGLPLPRSGRKSGPSGSAPCPACSR